MAYFIRSGSGFFDLERAWKIESMGFPGALQYTVHLRESACSEMVTDPDECARIEAFIHARRERSIMTSLLRTVPAHEREALAAYVRTRLQEGRETFLISFFTAERLGSALTLPITPNEGVVCVRKKDLQKAFTDYCRTHGLTDADEAAEAPAP